MNNRMREEGARINFYHFRKGSDGTQNQQPEQARYMVRPCNFSHNRRSQPRTAFSDYHYKFIEEYKTERQSKSPAKKVVTIKKRPQIQIQKSNKVHDSVLASSEDPYASSGVVPDNIVPIGPFASALNELLDSFQTKKSVDKKKILEKLYLDCLDLNKEAMQSLSYGRNQDCIQQLKEAEAILVGCKRIQRPVGAQIKLFSLTLNNFGCYYKKTAKPHAALKYLRCALRLEKQDPLITAGELAGTYLNKCAIYSQLGQHHEAISNALKSINFVKKFADKLKLKNSITLKDGFSTLATDIHEMLSSLESHREKCKEADQRNMLDFTKSQITEGSLEEDDESGRLPLELDPEHLPEGDIRIDDEKLAKAVSNHSLATGANPAAGQTQNKDPALSSTFTTYAAAYYNLGASFEHLRKLPLALKAYQRGMKICQKHIPESGLLAAHQESINQVSAQIKKKQTQHMFKQISITQRNPHREQAKKPSGAQSVRHSQNFTRSKPRNFQTIDADKISRRPPLDSSRAFTHRSKDARFARSLASKKELFNSLMKHELKFMLGSNNTGYNDSLFNEAEEIKRTNLTTRRHQKQEQLPCEFEVNFKDTMSDDEFPPKQGFDIQSSELPNSILQLSNRPSDSRLPSHVGEHLQLRNVQSSNMVNFGRRPRIDSGYLGPSDVQMQETRRVNLRKPLTAKGTGRTHPLRGILKTSESGYSGKMNYNSFGMRGFSSRRSDHNVRLADQFPNPRFTSGDLSHGTEKTRFAKEVDHIDKVFDDHQVNINIGHAEADPIQVEDVDEKGGDLDEVKYDAPTLYVSQNLYKKLTENGQPKAFKPVVKQPTASNQDYMQKLQSRRQVPEQRPLTRPTRNHINKYKSVDLSQNDQGRKFTKRVPTKGFI